MQGDRDGSGAEEERDLAEGVHGDVQAAAEDAPTIGQSCAEDDVGELTDGGIRQAGLEVVLGHSHQRANEDRSAGRVGQISAQARIGEQVDAEDIDDHLEDGKDARLDHGDCVQEGADWGRSHHSGGEPAVKGHQRGLARAEGIEKEQDADGPRRCLASEDAARNEVKSSGDVVSGDQACEQEADRGRKQHPHIDASPRFSLRAAMVRNQRIGRKRQRLIAEKQRQHVAGKCRTQGTGDRQGEEGEEAGLIFLVMTPHVADGVHRGRHPQPSGDQRKERAERFDFKG